MQFLSSLAPYVPWGLRLSVAATFIYHGLTKFPPDAFAQAMGFPLALGWLVGICEVAAGVCLLIGPFTREVISRVGGLLVMAVMVGAILLVHLPHGWDSTMGGMEFQVLLLLTGFFFVVRGNHA